MNDTLAVLAVDPLEFVHSLAQLTGEGIRSVNEQLLSANEKLFTPRVVTSTAPQDAAPCLVRQDQ